MADRLERHFRGEEEVHKGAPHEAKIRGTQRALHQLTNRPSTAPDMKVATNVPEKSLKRWKSTFDATMKSSEAIRR